MLRAATATVRARPWRAVAHYSTRALRVYASANDVPLVRTDFHAETRVWTLQFLGQETKDHRLTHSMIQQGLLPALRDVRQQWEKWVEARETEGGAALVTTAPLDSKIFSNGLDLQNAIRDPHFFNDCLNVLTRELLTFPIPTVAAVTGHAFAAGCTLALAHDYRVMNAQRGYLCMNEIEFGAPIPRGMLGAIQSVATKAAQRKLLLEAHRFTATDAQAYGLVHATADGTEATLQKALELAAHIRSRAAKGAWQSIKEALNADAVAMQYEPPRAKPLLV
ncbi:hypothetical protein MEQU1_002693 [Malassezia equina]|uniref:Uncharacterized protein n=1 Tax=Malassezia equina TaxID=1381935 RepID=A0AAF0EG72_9BASI|nr:hypothetical protein MEQU1_002693 [Malassezia equina]